MRAASRTPDRPGEAITESYPGAPLLSARASRIPTPEASQDDVRDFFALFGDFGGYVSFFLLDDLIAEDRAVKFFMPFDDFRPPSIPKDLSTYMGYRRRSIEFVEARNYRISELDL